MRRALGIVVLLVAMPAAAGAAEPPALARARTLYNAGNYEGAIDAAAVARRQPQSADAASLVIARAHLERYRQHADPADLTDAREALGTVKAGSLNARDQLDLLIGLGQSLYLGEIYGGAAELFDTALSRATSVDAGDRLLLLDWWATSLDREAQTRPADHRAPVFERIAVRMEEELRRDPGNGPANYWLAAATRGAGDVDRAWDAAVAAWVRSRLSPGSADALRTDLDRLVSQALIPERARSRAPRDPADATAALRAEWDLVKQQWK